MEVAEIALLLAEGEEIIDGVSQNLDGIFDKLGDILRNLLVERYPPFIADIYKNMFEEFKSRGFSDEQAFLLIIDARLSMKKLASLSPNKKKK